MKILLSLALILCAFGFSLTVSAQSGNKKNERTAPKTEPQVKIEQSDSKNESVADEEVLRFDTNLVTVPVTVSDCNGRFVPGLTKDDFQIFEDGKPQQIEYFAATEQPFTVALLLDVSLSASLKIDEIQGAAYFFVQQLRPADRVLVVSFDQEVQFLNEQPTSDRETLRQAIIKTKFGGGTSIYEAMRLTFERMRKIKGRKAIVVFTDGVDTTSRLTSDFDNLREAQELDALIYPIRYDTYEDVQAMKNSTRVPSIINPNPVPGSPVPFPTPDPRKGPTIPGTDIQIPLPQRRTQTQTRDRYPDDPTATGRPQDQRGRDTIPVLGGGDTPQEYQRAKEYLEKLAQNTGGRIYSADSKGALGRAFDQIAEELRRQYSLGYYPATEGKTGEVRRIKVKVNREKVAVSARGGYIVKKNVGN